ncbi:hypothetical protein IAT38_007056 [Cryptococcus sp. DSM 104549]
MPTSTVTHLSPALIRAAPRADAPSAPSPAVYQLVTLVTYFIYLSILPIYILYLLALHVFTPRPFPSWTLSRRLSTRLVLLRTNLYARWIPPAPPDEWSVQPWEVYVAAQDKGEVEVEVVKIQPVGDEWRQGLASVSGVESVERPGFMITPKEVKAKGGAPAGAGERIVLHIHGGGYIRGHPLWTLFPMEIAKLTGYRCFSVNYRKTLSTSSSFPAPLLDVLAAYLYLTQTLQFPSSSIILLGESAGAHLALLLSQYLSSISLPQPGYIALSSPWADFKLSYPSYELNKSYDQLCPPRLRRAVQSATRWYDPAVLATPWFSPSRAPVEYWGYLAEEEVKVYLQYGSRELFQDEILALGAGLRGAGVDVFVREDVDGLHTGGLNVPEAKAAFQKDLLQLLS